MAFSTNGTFGSDSLSSEINVTPLIDVLLVMLIIFMVIVPEMPRGLSSSVSSSVRSGTVDEAVDHPIFVQVESGRMAVRYVVNGADVERAELRPCLVKLLSKTSARQVLLKADASLDFGVIAGVIDAGRGAGAESVGLLTPRDEIPSR